MWMQSYVVEQVYFSQGFVMWVNMVITCCEVWLVTEEKTLKVRDKFNILLLSIKAYSMWL